MSNPQTTHHPLCNYQGRPAEGCDMCARIEAKATDTQTFIGNVKHNECSQTTKDRANKWAYFWAGFLVGGLFLFVMNIPALLRYCHD